MSPAPVSPLIVLALILIPLLAGLILLRTSRRRIGSAPHCPRCDYLLYGNTTAVCPECGHAVTQENIVHGERTRSRLRLVTGGLLVLAALALTATLGVDTYRRYDWYGLRPTAWLIDEAGSRSRGADPSRAWRELERRMREGKLTDDHQGRIVALALAEQANDIQDPPPKPTSPIILDLLGYLGDRQLAGNLSPDQSKQFFENSVRVKLRVRPLVFKGDSAPLEISHIGCSPTFPWYVCYEKTTLTVPAPDGRPVVLPSGGGGATSGVGASGAFVYRVHAAPPGDHEVTVSQVVRIVHTRDTVTQETKPLYEFTATSKATLRVVDDPGQTLKLIDDPTKDQAMLRTVSVKHIAPAGSPYPRLAFRVNFDAPPESVAADVFLRWSADGRTHEDDAGSVYVARGKTTSWGLSTDRSKDFPPTAAKVDVILRPSQKVARETVDLMEMWNREIVIKDVPLTPK